MHLSFKIAKIIYIRMTLFVVIFIKEKLINCDKVTIRNKRKIEILFSCVNTI